MRMTEPMLQRSATGGESMGCKHLYEGKVDSASIGSDLTGEHLCRLKDDKKRLLGMSGRHARQLGVTLMRIGPRCPFVAGARFIECGWCEQKSEAPD